jgi:uncharacterized membrane protein
MGIFTFTLPAHTAYMAVLSASAVLFWHAKSARWEALGTPGAFSAWCACCTVLPLLWSFAIPVASGLALHLFGMPLFVLMFGRALAMTGISLSVVAFTALHDGLWSNLGMNLLLLAVLPAYCGEAVMRITKRFFPHHLFVYLLGNGFFGALLMLATIGLASVAAHRFWVSGAPLQFDILAYMLLLAWGEAFLTGLLLTMFTVYRPQWVLTFDDQVYLDGH